MRQQYPTATLQHVRHHRRIHDPDDEGRGVLEFKQGFNGHAEELVGACTLPTSTIRYKLVEAVHAIKPLKKAGQTEDGR
mgnify:CR=1 FL=1